MRTEYPHHLPGFDYLGCYRYFLTFCCEERHPTFVDPAVVDLVWSQFVRAADAEGFSIIACCFMPEHVHFLVEGLDDNSDLKAFTSRAKQLSGYEFKKRHQKRLWQRYCYEHVVRDQESTKEVIAYIIENPVRAKLVQSVYEYPHLLSTLYGREDLIEFAYRGGSG
jgi:REP element-mobilizing transposase RayT